MADAATPRAQTTTSNALTRFLADTRSVAARDASAPTRRRLLRLVQLVEGNAFSRPSRSVFVYALRLLAFGLILVAIIDKHRSPAPPS